MAESQASRHVLVVGGGLAGCTAALALARRWNAANGGALRGDSAHATTRANHRITLIEAKSRLGGRVGSFTDAASGQAIDYCQHVGMNCCSALKQLIEWLDQTSLWQVQRDLYFYGPGPQRQRLSALPLPAPLHLSSWLWKWPGLNWFDRYKISRGMMALNRVPLGPGLPESRLEHCSALEWLRAHGQSDRVLERFWSTIIVSALGEQLDRVGLLPMAKVFQDGFLRNREAYHLLVPQRPLDDLFGKQMQTALAANDVQVQLSTTIQNVRWHGSQAGSVTLSTGEILEPSHIIVAVPWHALPPVLGSCPANEIQQILEQANQLQSSPISGVHTWWDRPWLPTPHAVLVGQLCQWIFPKADRPAANTAEAKSDAPHEHYYQIVISASRMLPRGDTEAVRSMIENDLREVFEEARTARLLRVRVVTDPQAVFSLAPGANQLRPLAGSHLGNIYWAGDWTNTGWPATMEGAIRSGLAAAESCAG